MKITKFGHCCLLIEENRARILTDPGIYSEKQNEITKIDIVLITHEHSDHFHVESIKEILKSNPKVKIITNTAVGKLLDKENINYQILENGNSLIENGVNLEAFGGKHALIYKALEPVQNTGYFINNKLFYSGDALTNPNKPVEILALPVAGPWIKLSEAIDYALALKPKLCFPVHDGILISFGSAHSIPQSVLPKSNIKFEILELNKKYEF
jgi:L-ascorbate metabolism protein UlaG (beta-lactamase superfamily)